MAKSPEEIAETMVANLRSTTGRSLEEWCAHLREAGATKHGEIVKLLKAEGVGHGYANLVAQRTLAGAAGDVDLVIAQYQGARAHLKPIHDALVAAAKKLGSDVDISPKKTSVSLRRARQFALIQPATNTRIDLGLKLPGVPVSGRLEKWPDTMCTHRVRLESAADVDRQVIGWLKQAFEAAK